MEENNNKNNMDKLTKLMLDTDKAMEMTRDKQLLIDIMKEDLMNETRPMMVEQRKTEITEKEQEKAEFDEMTKNALVKAKTEVLKIREQSEKEYQGKLLETLEKRKQIEKKLESMENKGLTDEKLAKARNSASKALAKVNEEMKEYQDKHFAKRAKLDEFEADINDYALELGVEIEPIKADEQKAGEEQVNEEPVNEEQGTTTNPAEPAVEEQEATTNQEETVARKTENGVSSIEGQEENEEELEENLSAGQELPKVASVEVKDDKYIITYETKTDGVYSMDKKECEKVGFFKGLAERFKIIASRKEYGIDFITSTRVDVNIFRNLNDKDKEKYLSYIAGQTAACFDINYDNPDSRYAKKLAKGQERLALKEADALEYYGPIIDEYDVDLKQQIEDELIAPEVDHEEHQKIQNKYDKMFGEGFDQHDNPPVVQTEEVKTIDPAKESPFKRIDENDPFRDL